MYRIEQRNKFSVGETVEIMKPDGQNVEVTVEKIIDEDGQEQESAPHPKQVLYVALSGEASVYDILRRQEGVTEWGRQVTEKAVIQCKNGKAQNHCFLHRI